MHLIDIWFIHVSFLIVCSYPIKFFLFSNYRMSFNVLRHAIKFRNSAVLRLRMLPLLCLDNFCKKYIFVLLCNCNVVSVRFTKAEKKESSPVESNWIRQKKVNKVALQVNILFKLKIFTLLISYWLQWHLLFISQSMIVSYLFIR